MGGSDTSHRRESEMSWIIALLAGCTWNPTEQGDGEVQRMPGLPSTYTKSTVHADVRTASGDRLGRVEFQASKRKVRVVGTLKGLAPDTTHAIHVHQGSVCEPPTFESAGAHFSPEPMEHGAPDAKVKHAGDLGNIVTDAEGTALVDVMADALDLDGSASVLGHTLVVHARADDLVTQPGGDAGDRIACGPIESSDPGK